MVPGVWFHMRMKQLPHSLSAIPNADPDQIMAFIFSPFFSHLPFISASGPPSQLTYTLSLALKILPQFFSSYHLHCVPVRALE